MSYDLAIVGGGPAAAAGALAARALGARTALIFPPGNGPRGLEMLAPSSTPLLCELGLVGHSKSLELRACAGTRTLWSDGDAVARSIVNPFGPGWIVDRRSFDGSLVEQAAAAGAVLIGGRAQAVEPAALSWRIDFKAGADRQFIHAGKLLLATGRSRRLARGLGVRFEAEAGELALLATVAGCVAEWEEEPLLVVEPAASGWIYGLPGRDGEALVGVTLPSALFAGEAEKAWNEAVLKSALYRRFFAGGAVVGERWARPGGAVHARSAQGSGWAIAGDLALSWGPVSGQGLAFALGSGSKAARSLLGLEAGGGYTQWLGEQRRFHALAKEQMALQAA